MTRITHEPTRQLIRKHRDAIYRASGDAQTIHAAQLVLDLANIETEDINTYHALAPVMDVTENALADIQDAIDRAVERLDTLTAEDPTPAPTEAPTDHQPAPCKLTFNHSAECPTKGVTPCTMEHGCEWLPTCTDDAHNVPPKE